MNKYLFLLWATNTFNGKAKKESLFILNEVVKCHLSADAHFKAIEELEIAELL